MADVAKPDLKKTEIDEQGQITAAKPPEVRMDTIDANKTYKEAKEKAQNTATNADTAGQKAVAAMIEGVTLAKPAEEPKKDAAKTHDKDAAGNKGDSEDSDEHDPSCPFHHWKSGFRNDINQWKLRNARVNPDGTSAVHPFEFGNAPAFAPRNADLGDSKKPTTTKAAESTESSAYKPSRTYSEYEARGLNQVNYYSNKISSAFGTLWNGAKNLVGLGDKTADASVESSATPPKKESKQLSARELAEASIPGVNSTMMPDSLAAGNDKSKDKPAMAAAFALAARSLHEDINDSLQNEMADGHDYAFVDRLNDTAREEWLKNHKDKQEDYNSYERTVKAGYYGQVDQLSADLKQIWLDRASEKQKADYERYEKQIKNGDYSSLDKIGKVPADLTDPKQRAEIENDFRRIYDRMSPEMKQGLDQYNDVRNAVKPAQNGDYKALADLAGTKPANPALDLWLKTASPEERQAFASSVLDKQMNAASKPEDTKTWYDNASAEQKKALFDALQKRTDAEKDAWWDKVSNPKASKENPWSVAQKDYLNDKVARDNGSKDGALDKNIDQLQKIQPSHSLSAAEKLQLGDYTGIENNFNKLSAREKEDLAKKLHDDPLLSKEERDAIAKMSKDEQARAGYLKQIGAPGKDLKEQLDNYQVFTVNEKSGYPSYTDKMNGNQLKEWLQDATQKQRNNYVDYVDAKAAGDYSFINGDNFDYFRKTSYGTPEWQNYKQFRDRVDAGDFTFLENLHGRNVNNINSYARYSDEDYAKYQDFKLKQAAGDYSFISKQSPEAQKNWYEHAGKVNKAAFDDYKKDLLEANFKHVEDYLQAKVKPPATIEQAREEWKKENAGILIDGKPLDVNAKYDAYAKDLTTYRTQVEDFRKLDKMTQDERTKWFEKHADEKDSYHDWQVKTAVADYSWVDRLPNKDRNELLKRYDEKTGDLKEEGAAYRAYTERMDAGDYSHIYMLDKDYYHKWKDNASQQQLDEYDAYVDRMRTGDFSYVDRYSEATKKDWQNRLDKLNPDLHKDEKDGLQDFRTNANLWRKDLDDGYKIYEKRIAAGDWSMIDSLKNDKNWNDFAINSTAEQWKAYKDYKDRISNGDYSFVDRLRDQTVPGAIDTPLSSWLSNASSAEKRAYLDFYNKQTGVTAADKTVGDDKLNDLITKMPKAATDPVTGAPKAGGDPVLVANAPKAGVDPITGGNAPKAGVDPVTGGNAPKAGGDPVAVANAPKAGVDPVLVANAPKAGGDPVLVGKAPKAGVDPVLVANAPKAGVDPVLVANAPKAGGDPVLVANAPKAGVDPVTGGNAPKAGVDPVTGGNAPKAGVDPVSGGNAPKGGEAPKPAGDAVTGTNAAKGGDTTNSGTRSNTTAGRVSDVSNAGGTQTANSDGARIDPPPPPSSVSDQTNKDKQIYDDFVKKLQAVKDDKQRSDLLNSVSKDSTQVKAIADFIASHPSSQELFKEITRQSEAHRDLATNDFVKLLSEKNPVIKELQQQAMREAPKQNPPAPASPPSPEITPGAPVNKPGDQPPKIQDPPPPDPKQQPGNGIPASGQVADPKHGNSNYHDHDDGKQNQPPQNPLPANPVNPTGGTTAPGALVTPGTPVTPGIPGTPGTPVTTGSPGTPGTPILDPKRPTTKTTDGEKANRDENGPIVNPVPVTPSGQLNNNAPGSNPGGNAPNPSGNAGQTTPLPGVPSAPKTDAPVVTTPGQNTGPLPPIASTPGQPGSTPITPGGNSDSPAKLGRTQSEDLYKEQIRKNPSEYTPPGSVSTGNANTDRPQSQQQNSQQQGQNPAPADSKTGNSPPVVVPTDKPANTPADKTGNQDLSRQTNTAAEKPITADGKTTNTDSRPGTPQNQDGKAVPASPTEGKIAPAGNPDQRQTDAAQTGAAGQKPAPVDTTSGTATGSQKERGSVAGDAVGLPGRAIDGKLTDASGRVLDASGKTVDAQGRVIDAAGRVIDTRSVDAQVRPVLDPQGRPVLDAQGRTAADAQGRTVADAQGRTVADAQGRTVADAQGRTAADAQGRPVADAQGRTVADAQGRPLVDAQGRTVIDTQGRVIDASGKVLDASGKTVGDAGGRAVVVDASGRVINADAGKANIEGNRYGADAVNVRPTDANASRLPDLSAAKSVDGRQQAEPGRMDAKPMPGGADQTSARPLDMPVPLRGTGDTGVKDGLSGRDGKPIVPERGIPVSAEQSANSKGQPGIVGGITGSIVMPVGKGESGKSEKGEVIEGAKPSSKDPGIGLSQLGQGGSGTPGQKPTTDPQGTAASGETSGVQLQPVNLPTVQITGQDPKGGTNVDPKAAGANADPKAAGVNVDPKAGGPNADPKAGGANVDPKAGGPNADPKAGGANVDPKAGGPNADPKAGGANVDPKAGGVNVDPKAGGANLDPKAGGANLDPKAAGANLDPKAAGANLDPKAAGTTVDPKAGVDPKGVNADPKTPSGKPDPKESLQDPKTIDLKEQNAASQKTGETKSSTYKEEAGTLPTTKDASANDSKTGSSSLKEHQTNENEHKNDNANNVHPIRPRLEGFAEIIVKPEHTKPTTGGSEQRPTEPSPREPAGDHRPVESLPQHPGSEQRPTESPREPAGDHRPVESGGDHRPVESLPQHPGSEQRPTESPREPAGDHRPVESLPQHPGSEQRPTESPREPAGDHRPVESLPQHPGSEQRPTESPREPAGDHRPVESLPQHPGQEQRETEPGPRKPGEDHRPVEFPQHSGHEPSPNNPGTEHRPTEPPGQHSPDQTPVEPRNPGADHRAAENSPLTPHGPQVSNDGIPAPHGPQTPDGDPSNLHPPQTGGSVGGHVGAQPAGTDPIPHIPATIPSNETNHSTVPIEAAPTHLTPSESAQDKINQLPATGAIVPTGHESVEHRLPDSGFKPETHELLANTPAGILTEIYTEPQIAVHHPEALQPHHRSESSEPRSAEKQVPSLQEQLAEDAKLLQSDSLAVGNTSIHKLEDRVDIIEKSSSPLHMTTPDTVSSVQNTPLEFIVHTAAQIPAMLSEEKIQDRVEQAVDEAINKFIHAGDPQAEMPAAQMDAIKLITNLVAGPGDELNATEAFSHLGAKLAADLGLGSTDYITPGDVISQALGLSEPDPIAQIEADILSTILPDSKKDEIDEGKELSDKERREYDEHLREDEARRYAAAMLAALKARQAQEEANRIRAQKDLLNVEARQKYIVMQGDTLELIAQKRLLNKRLAPLIYEINKSRIPIKVKEGKRLLQLKPKLVILLPTQIEIRRFQTRLFGKNTERFEYDHSYAESSQKAPSLQPSRVPQLSGGDSSQTETMTPKAIPPQASSSKNAAIPTDRRANVEALLGKISDAENEARIKYMCRLGDSLRSIAMRHPALNDLRLWKLVARLNDLSTQVDESGNPTAELKRGQQIVLPSPKEIAEFYKKQNASKKSEAKQPGAKALEDYTQAQSTDSISQPSASKASAEARFSGKPCPSCGRIATMGALSCANCSHLFNAVRTNPGLRKLDDLELPPVDDSEDYQLMTHSRIMLGARDFLLQRSWKSSAPLTSRLDSIIQTASERLDDFNSQAGAKEIAATTDANGNSASELAPGSPEEATNRKAVETVIIDQSRGSEPRNHIEFLSDDCRIVSFGNMGENGPGYRARLEFRQNAFWLPVMLYEINEDSSARHQYLLNGSRKTRKIDLPARQAKQLANNDLNKNWQQYVDSFLKQP